MEKIISYDKSLQGSMTSSLDFDYWKQVMDKWDAKDYKGAIIGTLEYINRKALTTYANADKTQIKAPHGSIMIDIHITDTEFIVSAPFVGLPDGPKVPLLRQVAQLNFHPLKLSSINLRNDQLFFEYRGPVDTCEPYKVYDVLYEITYYADQNDDDFIRKFNAKRLNEPNVKYYDAETAEKCWLRFQQIVEECKEYIAHFEGKRLQYFVWDIVSITLRKIEYYLSPQGVLRVELEKIIGDLMNQNIQMNDKINRGKEFINKLAAYDKNSFLADFYKPEIFVPYKTSSSLENVRKSMEQNVTRFTDEYNRKDFLAAAYTGLYAIYDLFYLYDMQDDIRECLEYALQQSAGKPYSEACALYRSAFDQIQSGNLKVNPVQAAEPAAKPASENRNEQKNGGFFKKIFGN